MNTRVSLSRSSFFGKLLCVYCGAVADTNDHVPPRCFMRRPLPSNLITLPACKKCNGGFSFDENVVRTMLSLVSEQPDLARERQDGGRAYRALKRDRRLRESIEVCRRPDGNFELAGPVLESFNNVLRKVTQGLYFGLYDKVLLRNNVQVLVIADRKTVMPDDLINEMRPSPFVDITDEPLSAITPSAWMMREPVFLMKFETVGGGKTVERVFRLIRQTPIKWICSQPQRFSYAFVQHADGRAVCIMDICEAIVAAVGAPWPNGRGPVRRGKRNPLSRP